MKQKQSKKPVLKHKWANQHPESFKFGDDYEICVLCRAITNVPKSMPVEMRSDYIPGAGQLCHECAVQNAEEERTAMKNGFVYTMSLHDYDD